MRSTLIALGIVLFCYSRAFSQPYLFGTNTSGNGNIIRYDVSANKLKEVSTFDNEGLHPRGLSALIRYSTGSYFGITYAGGKEGLGVLFMYDSLGRLYHIVHDFGTGSQRMRPIDQPVLASNGFLYGAATLTDKRRSPVIYSYDPETGTFEVNNLYDRGVRGMEALLRADDGKFYWTGFASTLAGSGMRVISYDPITREVEVISNPEDPHANYEFGKLVTPGNGLMYSIGNGNNYGTEGRGTITSFDPKTYKTSVVKSFREEDGSGPASLTAYRGKLYGTTGGGGRFDNGVIFSFDPLTAFYDTLVSLPEDTEYPSHDFAENLLIDPFGIIHGMDQNGMYSFNPFSKIYTRAVEEPRHKIRNHFYIVNDTGLVVVSSGEYNYQLLKRLSGPDGLKPQEGLSKGISGLLYGATTEGGRYGYGTLYSFDPNTGQRRTLFDLNRTTRNPGPVVEMEDGGLYFLVEAGIDPYRGDGSLVRYDKATGTINVLHDFGLSGLTVDINSLTAGPDQQLFGVGSGKTLFQYSTQTQTFQRLFTFSENLTDLVSKYDRFIYGLTQVYSGQGSLVGIMQYNTITGDTAFFPYRASPDQYPLSNKSDHRLTLDIDGNILIGFPAIWRFNTFSHLYSKVTEIDYQLRSGFKNPLLVTQDSAIYFSGITDMLDSYSAYPVSIKRVAEQSGKQELLANCYNPKYFKPVILKEERIIDPPVVSIIDTVANEADGKATIRIHLNRSLPNELRLYYRTLKGSANGQEPGRDYLSSSGYITVKKGTVNKYLTVNVFADSLQELNEHFFVEIIKARSVSEVITIPHDPALVVIRDRNIITTIASGDSSLPAGSTLQRVAAEATGTGWKMSISPNPSTEEFHLRVLSNNSRHVQLLVFDAMGRLVAGSETIMPGQSKTMGANWKPGVYYGLIKFGKVVHKLKLVKL